MNFLFYLVKCIQKHQSELCDFSVTPFVSHNRIFDVLCAWKFCKCCELVRSECNKIVTKCFAIGQILCSNLQAEYTVKVNVHLSVSMCHIIPKLMRISSFLMTFHSIY